MRLVNALDRLVADVLDHADALKAGDGPNRLATVENDTALGRHRRFKRLTAMIGGTDYVVPQNSDADRRRNSRAEACCSGMIIHGGTRMNLYCEVSR